MTGFVIQSGRSGNTARVGDDERLWTDSLSQEAQHIFSRRNHTAYQINEAPESVSSGTNHLLYIENTSTDKIIVFTFIRHQVFGLSGHTALPNISNFFYMSVDYAYSSGGGAIDASNMYVGSGKKVPATLYNANPTLSGTATIIDRWYTKEQGDMNIYNKHGVLILPPNKTLTFSYDTDAASGSVSLRTSFFVMDENGI